MRQYDDHLVLARHRVKRSARSVIFLAGKWKLPSLWSFHRHIGDSAVEDQYPEAGRERRSLLMSSALKGSAVLHRVRRSPAAIIQHCLLLRCWFVFWICLSDLFCCDHSVMQIPGTLSGIIVMCYAACAADRFCAALQTYCRQLLCSICRHSADSFCAAFADILQTAFVQLLQT